MTLFTRSRIILMASVLMLTACASHSTPDPVREISQVELQKSAYNQPKIIAPLSIYEAVARGLKYNLSYQQDLLKVVEVARQKELRRQDLLPKSQIISNFSYRSNREAFVGQRVEDMQSPLSDEFYTSTDKQRRMSQYALVWNIMDFGFAYLDSQRQELQRQDNHLGALVTCGRLIEDIEGAYWRTATYERARKKSEWLEGRVKRGLYLSQQMAKQDPDRAQEQLYYQRELIDIYRWYKSIYIGTSAAPGELARLLNLPMQEALLINSDEPHRQLTALPMDPNRLVLMAFHKRPEIRQRLLQETITKIAARQEMLKSYPNISFFLGGGEDTNSFTLNKNYLKLGADLTWNMLELAKRQERKALAQTRRQQSILQTEMMAGVVAAQVSMAIAEFSEREKEIELAWRAVDIQEEITNKTQLKMEQGDGQEIYVIKEELMRELAILRRDISRADHQIARSRLIRSLGVNDICTMNFRKMTIHDLAQSYHIQDQSVLTAEK